MDSAFIKTEIVFRNFVCDAKLPSIQFVKTVKAASGQCIPFVKGIMNNENVPKEIVKSFIDLVDMAKGLMDENQQTSVQQELEKLLPSTRGEGRGSKSRELHRVGAGESLASTATDTNTSFATPSTTKWTISEIWESKTCGDLSKFAIFSNVKPSDFRIVTCYMSILEFGLP